MKYNLLDDNQFDSAKKRLYNLREKGSTIDMTEKKLKGTMPQNRYLHLILSDFALNFGMTKESAKLEIFKKLVNPEIFYICEFEGFANFSEFKSTAELTQDEKTTAINKFIKFSAEHGHNLPDPENLAHLYEIENQIESIQNAKYL